MLLTIKEIIVIQIQIFLIILLLYCHKYVYLQINDLLLDITYSWENSSNLIFLYSS